MAIVLNSENFESEVLKSSIPVLVDFWTEWCGPCKMMTSIIEELSSEYKDKIKIAKLNLDEAEDIAAQLGIMSIPTFILFNQEKEISRLSGAMPKERLKDWIESNIKF